MLLLGGSLASMPDYALKKTRVCLRRHSPAESGRPSTQISNLIATFESGVLATQHFPFHLFAYVVMPQHVHVVLQPVAGVTMKMVLWHLKRPVTAAALSWVKTNRPDFLSRMADVRPSGEVTLRFWQRGGGYDRNLRSPRDVSEKIRYIHHNPVRKELVKRPEDWPFSSAAQWILRRPGPVSIDWDRLPELDAE